MLTFPWEVRFLLAMDRKFLSEMLRVFLRTLFAWQRLRGRRAGIADGQPGAVTFIQRVGGILNLNPHFHSLLLDGLFVQEQDEQLVFKPLPPPTDEDILRLTARLAERLGAMARRRMVQAELDPPWDQDDDAHVLASNGTVEAVDREGLERLCRYGLRSPLSLERLSVDPDGQVHYQLRRPWFDGRTEIVLDPLAFMRRLSALIPAPYANLVRYHGIFANRSRFRDRLPSPPAAEEEGPPLKDEKYGSTEEASVEDNDTPTRRPRRTKWAHLMRRTLDIDVLTCPKCAASMTIIAFLTDPNVLTKILEHLKLPSTPPTLAPARSSFAEKDLFSNEEIDEPVCSEDPGPVDGPARAPP